MTDTPVRSGYAPVNGLHMYYQIHGAGFPLVLIHGGFGVVGMFDQLVPALAAGRRVIAVELQGHGHTADIDRPFSQQIMADDIAALIKYLGFAQADVLGYSLGSGVAMQTAIRHPELVRKLVAIAAPGKTSGWYPDVCTGMAAMSVEGMTNTPLYDIYRSVAPDPGGWPALVTKTRQLLTGPDFDWTADIARITAPTLLVFADADSIHPEHIVELFGLFGGGKADGGMAGLANIQLAILPGTTHYTILSRPDLLLPSLLPFLGAD